VLRRVSSPHVSFLGRVPGHDALRDMSRHDGAEAADGVVVARPNAELFFANVSGVRTAVIEEVDRAEASRLVLDLEMTAELDAPAAEGLHELCEDLLADGVEVHLARVHGEVRPMLDRVGVTSLVGVEHIHDRISEALPPSA